MHAQPSIIVNTWDEEDAGQGLTRLPWPNPDGYCPDPCLGVGVLHAAHEEA